MLEKSSKSLESWIWDAAYTRESAMAAFRQELAAGVVLGKSAFGGKPKNICSL